jgi:RNA polymerase sigma factor (sigma-70 family)
MDGIIWLHVLHSRRLMDSLDVFWGLILSIKIREEVFLIEEAKVQMLRFGENDDEIESQISSHTNYLKKIISGILHNQEDAEDAYQEIVHKIYQGYPGWRKENFKAWIARIAVNHCLDNKKKLSKESQSVDLENLELEQPDLADPLAVSVRSPQDILLDKESRQEIQKILLELPEIYHEVLKLYYETNATMEEIAKQMNLGQRTVETRIYRARKMVSEKWRNHAH